MAMGQMISPGVYTKIIDLSEYLQDIIGTVGFIPILSKRGPDNKLVLVTSNEQFYTTYGQPNILDYGKYFGQGPYIATQHLGVSSHLYVLRALPTDATYSHVVIGMQEQDYILNTTYSSSSAGIPLSRLTMVPLFLDGQNHPYTGHATNEYPSTVDVYILDTVLNTADTEGYMNPDLTGGVGVVHGMLMYFRGLGRGGSYNDFAIQLTRHVNSELFGIYVLDIYETRADGSDVIIESFNVSFDPDVIDQGGDSLFIEDVVNKFSANVRCKVNREALHELELYKMDFYKNDPTLPEDATQYIVLDENGQKTDLGFKAAVIEFASLDYTYAQHILDMTLQDLTIARAMPTSTTQEIIDRNKAVTAALLEVSTARAAVDTAKATLEDAYQLDIMNLGDADPSVAGVQPWHFREGSEGSLLYNDKATGKVQVSYPEAVHLLVEAYSGLLKKADLELIVDPVTGNARAPKDVYVDEIFDLDWIYFSLVYDAGYDPDVKDAAYTLCNTYRRDCMLISDCGDNMDYQDVEDYVGGNPAIPSGRPWDSRYVARYEPYSRIYDKFVGRDLWVSPVYHMAQSIPLSDSLYEIWYAVAGLNRGMLESIKELRWSAKLGERDYLYLLQVNPIVHFPQGYTIWGNLTTQKRPTALQDVNVMRLVLYIKRALEQFCKYFIFEFNDQTTWNQIKVGITPFLDAIKSRRGLVSYSVEVGATDYEFKSKICHVNVTLTPMKVIEKIELNLYVK